MTKEEIEQIRESEVFAFMAEHGGSVLLREKSNRAYIGVPGPTPTELMVQSLLVAATLGLWIPVAVWWLYRHRARVEIIHVFGDGTIDWTTA